MELKLTQNYLHKKTTYLKKLLSMHQLPKFHVVYFDEISTIRVHVTIEMSEICTENYNFSF